MNAQDLLRQLRAAAEVHGPHDKVSQQWLRGMLCDLAPESRAGTAAFFEAVVALDRASVALRSGWVRGCALVALIDKALTIDLERNPSRKPPTEADLEPVPF